MCICICADWACAVPPNHWGLFGGCGNLCELQGDAQATVENWSPSSTDDDISSTDDDSETTQPTTIAIPRALKQPSRPSSEAITEVQRLYSEYSPEKLPGVLVEKYGETELLRMVKKKYRKPEVLPRGPS